MKLSQHIFGLVCSLLFALGFASCLDSKEAETVVTNYNNAIITAFSLEENSNVCSGLSGYKFTIDNYGFSDDSIHQKFPDDGIIFNADSLPAGVIPDSIKVSLTFSSPDSVIFRLYEPDGTLGQVSNYSKDSALYFASYLDSRLTVIANGGYRKTYHVKVNVHKVNGDTIVWHNFTDELWADMKITDQRTDTLGNRYCWLVEEDGMRNKISTALMNGTPRDWQPMADVIVPEGDLLDLSTLYNWHNGLYAVGKRTGKLLTSTDGYNWEVANEGLRFQTILGNQYKTQDVYGNWNSDSLNAIIRIDDHYHFAVSANAKNWVIEQEIPSGFPISGFSRPIFTAARSNYGNLTSRLYIVGGVSATGELTSSTWSCDGWSADRKGLNWVEFPQSELKPLQGASIIEYTLNSERPGSLWLLQPGITSNGDVLSNMLFGKRYTTLYYSEDNGVSWHRLSRYFTQYADNSALERVSCSSAFHDPVSFQMYFFGGKKEDGTFKTAVWGGVLNSLTFDLKR